MRAASMLLLFLALAAVPDASALEEPPRLAYVWRIGAPAGSLDPAKIQLPHDLLVDPAGDVLIHDAGSGGYKRFTGSGTFVAAVDGIVAMRDFNDLAVAPDSTVFISRTGFLLAYSHEGEYLGAWGESTWDYGHCDKELWGDCEHDAFGEIAIGFHGTLYNRKWCRLPPCESSIGIVAYEAYDSTGTRFIQRWVSDMDPPPGPYSAMQEGPRGVLNWAVCMDESPYLTIKRLTTQFDPLDSFTISDTPCDFNSYRSTWATFDTLGRAYVFANGPHTVSKYDRAGQLLVRWAVPTEIPDDGLTSARIAVGADSLIYVAIGNASLPQSTTVFVYSYDADGDSLLDAWEKYGIDGDDDGVVDYRLKDADPLHKDLYVEVDAMSGLAPHPDAIPAVIAAFAKVPNRLLRPPNPDSLDGITLHVEIDETTLPVASWAQEALPEFAAFKRDHFGTPSERDSAALIVAKRRVVRYGPFVKQFGASTSSGQAFRIPSYDFFVSLGHPKWVPTTWQEQAGTFMHELGHGLGLCHGGELCDEAENYKPNYYSVMNYAWQTPLREVWPGIAQKSLNLLRSNWPLDYSRVTRPTIDENAASEVTPIALPEEEAGYEAIGPPCANPAGLAMLVRSDLPVNWNRDGTISGTACVDANLIGPAPATPGGTLTGTTDWSMLVYLPFAPSVPPVWNAPSVADRTHLRPVELTAEMLESLSRMRFDCNGNGVPDDVEIEAGEQADANQNGIPDACERVATLEAPGTSRGELGVRVWAAPNPSRGTGAVRFVLPRPGLVRLVVFDAGGRRVRSLRDSYSLAGEHSVAWDGLDSAGAQATPGVYFVRLQYEGRSWTVHLSLVR